VSEDKHDELELLKRLGQEEAGPDTASEARARMLLERRIAGGGDGRRRPWRPFHLRLGLVVALALLLGSAFGFAVGTSNTSSGNAANAPVGVGFLPERGWSVLQTARRATLSQEAIAIAANVPISPDDAADRLPYSTMLTLPKDGIVMMASFTARGDKLRDQHFPVRALPFRLRDAAPGLIQVRAKSPLRQYRVHGGVNGHNVDVTVYFGTPRPRRTLFTAAQRQLDRLVVRPSRTGDQVEERAFPIRAASKPGIQTRLRQVTRVIDRTLVCTLEAPLGDARDLDLLAAPPLQGQTISGNFYVPAFIGVSSSRVIASSVSDRSNRVFVRARSHALPGRTLPAGVFVNAGSCSAVRTPVPLSPRGLPGPPLEYEQDAECRIRGRILVHVRARLQTAAGWEAVGDGYAGARANVVEAAIAVRNARTRKALAFMQLRPQGRTRFWAAQGCG
jgi:hypothetical protein